MICLTCILSNERSYATVEQFPIGKNYLDLNQMIETNRPNQFKSKESFIIKENTTYTIVMSKAFLRDLYDTIDTKALNLTHLPSGIVSEPEYYKDEVNQRAYVTIAPSVIPGDNLLYIEDLFMPTSHLLPNYEIILYEGTYNDFPGYEPYLSQDDQTTYYGNMNINYDNLPSSETIKTYITATNPLGQSVLVNVINDTYTPSQKLPGTYTMEFEAVYNLISKRYLLSISVKDLTPPNIYVNQPLQIQLSNKVDINTLLSYIIVNDNVDNLTYQNLNVIHDAYTQATTTGTYQITVEAIDTSANKKTETFDVQLIDTTNPIIKGPSQLYLYIGDPVMTAENILSYYQFTDDVKVNPTSISVIYDNYMQTQNPGVYQLTIEVADLSSNKTTKDIYIHVIDNRGPEFNVNPTYIITVSPTEIKSDSDIIIWLEQTLESEGINPSNISIDYNEYALKSDQKGQYYVYMSYQIEQDTYQTRVLMDVVGNKPFYTNPLYLLTLIPVPLFIGYIIYRKQKQKI